MRGPSSQADVYCNHMKRTQIYITDEQDRRVAEMALDRRVSKAEVIRQILDGGLDTGDPESEAVATIRATAGICADYPDWPEWLAEARGRGADARLRDVGL